MYKLNKSKYDFLKLNKMNITVKYLKKFNLKKNNVTNYSMCKVFKIFLILLIMLEQINYFK